MLFVSLRVAQSNELKIDQQCPVSICYKTHPALELYHFEEGVEKRCRRIFITLHFVGNLICG